DSGELGLQPGAFLPQFCQRSFDGLHFLAPRSEVAAFVGARAALLALVLAYLGLSFLAHFRCGRRRGGTGALLQPAGVVLEVTVEIADRAVRDQPELVADAAQQPTIV